MNVKHRQAACQEGRGGGGGSGGGAPSQRFAQISQLGGPSPGAVGPGHLLKRDRMLVVSHQAIFVPLRPTYASTMYFSEECPGLPLAEGGRGV